MEEIIVYLARRIHTMNPGCPTATAVATRGKDILEVGDLDQMGPWLDGKNYRIDRRFEDKIFLPGLIDPHLHPIMAAVLLPMHFITALDWNLPNIVSTAITGLHEYLERLAQIEGGLENAEEPLFTWGYHQFWHGVVDREALNRISQDRPIIVWHRGFHELIVNDATLKWMDIPQDTLDSHPHVKLQAGRFFETGLSLAISALKPYLLDPDRISHGLSMLKDIIHQGGHTTIGDMAVGLFDQDMELGHLHDFTNDDALPFRMMGVPIGIGFGKVSQNLDAELQRVSELQTQGNDRFFFRKHVKLFADGGMFASLMQLLEPGFIDGASGHWLTPPSQLEETTRLYWREGYHIHVHCCGDMGLEATLDILEKLQWERPRFGHRFTIEHFGLSTPEQVQRISDLGAIVSANVYYLHELSDAYWKHNIGYGRASQMARLGELERNRVRFSFHSDFTMAPAQPLYNAWVAVNRVSESGAIMAPDERISVHQAMKAITVDAAYVLGLEHMVGSLRGGKRADITVLEQDPYEIDPMGLKDLKVEATIFEGQVYDVGS